MIFIKRGIEKVALFLLWIAGTPIMVYPAHMEAYRDEITQLCKAEDAMNHQVDDILGTGYFKGRRVMSKMKKKYPALKVRDLWKAVDICSA